MPISPRSGCREIRRHFAASASSGSVAGDAGTGLSLALARVVRVSDQIERLLHQKGFQNFTVFGHPRSVFVGCAVFGVGGIGLGILNDPSAALAIVGVVADGFVNQKGGEQQQVTCFCIQSDCFGCVDLGDDPVDIVKFVLLLLASVEAPSYCLDDLSKCAGSTGETRPG